SSRRVRNKTFSFRGRKIRLSLPTENAPDPGAASTQVFPFRRQLRWSFPADRMERSCPCPNRGLGQSLFRLQCRRVPARRNHAEELVASSTRSSSLVDADQDVRQARCSVPAVIESDL